MSVHRLWPLLVALSLSPAAAFAANVQVDRGRLVFHLRDQVIGAESFSLEASGDSLILISHAYQLLRTSPPESLKKQVILVAQRMDYGLKSYQSNLTHGRDQLVRGIVMGDTAFTIYREVNGSGEGDRRVLPPGRIFVLDAQLFSLVNLICLSLKDKTFETWPIQLVTLSDQDSVMTGIATHLGRETIRWASKPVTARKLTISDGTTTFLVWADPAGKMLRLVHEPTQLRIERDPPAVKRRAASPPKPSG